MPPCAPWTTASGHRARGRAAWPYDASPEHELVRPLVGQLLRHHRAQRFDDRPVFLTLSVQSGQLDEQVLGSTKASPPAATRVPPGLVAPALRAGLSWIRRRARVLDVAECVRWTVALPPHVNVDRIDVKPVRQAGVARFVREA